MGTQRRTLKKEIPDALWNQTAEGPRTTRWATGVSFADGARGRWGGTRQGMAQLDGDDPAGRQDRRALARRLPPEEGSRPQALHRAQVLQARRARRDRGGDGAQARGVRLVLASGGRARQPGPRRRQRRRLPQARGVRGRSLRRARGDARGERRQDPAAPRAADPGRTGARGRRQLGRSRGDVHQAHQAPPLQGVPRRAAPIARSQGEGRGSQLGFRRRRSPRARRGARDVARRERRRRRRRRGRGRRRGARGGGAVHLQPAASGDAWGWRI